MIGREIERNRQGMHRPTGLLGFRLCLVSHQVKRATRTEPTDLVVIERVIHLDSEFGAILLGDLCSMQRCV